MDKPGQEGRFHHAGSRTDANPTGHTPPCKEWRDHHGNQPGLRSLPENRAQPPETVSRTRRRGPDAGLSSAPPAAATAKPSCVRTGRAAPTGPSSLGGRIDSDLSQIARRGAAALRTDAPAMVSPRRSGTAAAGKASGGGGGQSRDGPAPGLAGRRRRGNPSGRRHQSLLAENR